MEEHKFGQGIISTQIGAIQQAKKVPQQQQDAECCDTKICMWDEDQFEEFDSEYLNQIFPYKISKKSMAASDKFIFHFLGGSLHYWVQLIQKQPQQGKLGLKDLKFLQQLFENDETDNFIAFRRWGKNFMKKQQFLKNQENQANFKPPANGEQIHQYQRGQDTFIVIQYKGSNKQFCEFKVRMEILFLFYIDGVSFINQENDEWVYFIIFKKEKRKAIPNGTVVDKTNQEQKSYKYTFIGSLSLYIFRISALKERHRISQVFILPSYQKSGHGKELLDLVYGISLKSQKCFEMTTEIPSFEYQCLRDYKQAQMILDAKLLDFSTIPDLKNAECVVKARQSLLNKETLRQIKQQFKLPGHQIQRIAFILIFYKIIKQDDDMVKAHFEEYLRQKIIINRSPFKCRNKLPHITFYGQSPEMKDFFLQKSKEDFLRNQAEIQELLAETIDGYYRVIGKLKRNEKL